MSKIKINKLDSLFSKIIRTRDNWTCQFCKKKYPEASQGLHCSHFWGRGKQSTRYDYNNCIALCAYCHFQHESNKQGFYRKWMLDKLGKQGYEDLEIKSNTICKRSPKDKEDLYSELKKKAKKLGI